jgi:hypothetical protein
LSNKATLEEIFVYDLVFLNLSLYIHVGGHLRGQGGFLEVEKGVEAGKKLPRK